MLVSRLFELGTHPQKDPRQNQLTRLINRICIFVMIVITPYMLLTLYFGSLLATIIQLIAILHLGLTVFLNSKQYFNLARAMTLMIGNFHIFVMSIVLGPESGIYFYFSAAIIAPLFFYTFKEIKYSIAFASLTIILTLVVHYFGPDFQPIVNAPELLITGFFYFSVFGSLVTIFGFVFYFYNESHKLEESLKNANSKLQKLSETDPLTLLPNRRSFYKNLEREWGKGIRTKNHCAIIMIDVDNFKMFNDLHGHQQGDNCLVSFAKIILQNTRDFLDFPARYGGEEFIILLCDTNLDNAYTIAERIRMEILRLAILYKTNKPYKLVTCSMGVASIVPNNEIYPDDLILKADKALYKAKAHGRNRVEKSL